MIKLVNTSTDINTSHNFSLLLGIMDIDLPKEQSQKEVVKKSSRSKSAAASLHKIKHKISKRLSESSSSQRSHKISTKKTYKDQKKHRLVLQQRILPDELELTYISKGKELLKGFIKGCGILCCCCEEVVSPTTFESHAGRPSSRKPYQHIFLSTGMSLHQYASTVKLNCRKQVENNDLLCMVCQKSGDLLFCEGCPRSFHKDCVSDTIVIPKKGFCIHCQVSMKNLVAKANAVKDGRVSGVDPNHPIEQIAKECIQIDNSCDQIACVLCRSCDFSEDGFGDETSIACDQCEKEYHIGCLKKDMNIDLKELPFGNWFCTADCESLYHLLKCIVSYGPLEAKYSYMQVLEDKGKGIDAGSITNLDIEWFVLNGKDACETEKLLLTQAVDIFHNCLNPVIDSVTGNDFIPSMAYGMQMGSSNFSGVYSALITLNSKVITAGMFRVFGREFAELSIVATSQPNQGKGYFELFFGCFAQLLSFLRIKKLLVPAIDNAKAMWTKKFGFKKVPPKKLAEYREIQTSMVAFHGTTWLQWDIPERL